jgi:hypothetical protein
MSVNIEKMHLEKADSIRMIEKTLKGFEDAF